MREMLYPVNFFKQAEPFQPEQREETPMIDIALPDVEALEPSVSSGVKCDRASGCPDRSVCNRSCAAQFMKAAEVTIAN